MAKPLLRKKKSHKFLAKRSYPQCKYCKEDKDVEITVLESYYSCQINKIQI
jgi:hypothetical protein